LNPVRCAGLLTCLLAVGALVLTATARAGIDTAAQGGAHAHQAQELAKLRSRIDALQKQLNEVQGRRHTVRDELTRIDRAIGQRVIALRRLGRQRDADEQRLQQLQRRAQRERQSLSSQRVALAEQARATYILGQQEYLKVLLNQQDPARVARALTYYRYFNEARLTRIDGIRKQLTRLGELEQEITQRRSAVDRLRTEQSQQKDALEQEQTQRRTVLTSLDREVRDRSRDLSRLKEDEARLERLLQQLEQVLPALPDDIPKDGRFANHRGRLPLPVVGRIRASFGEPKPVGQLKWRGILIEAPEGNNVRAVFRGRVAYAEWLRGFGLLLILDHGGGYMTLYGHNQGLYKDVGEWVESGEIIAAVGATGDVSSPGVYFEVRHNGKPSDPLQWCARRERGRRASRR